MQSYMFEGITDAEVYNQELQIAVWGDELGYDHVWTVEHHFEDYSFCPDNFVYLAHLAARTKRIKLMTGAVIVPSLWMRKCTLAFRTPSANQRIRKSSRL